MHEDIMDRLNRLASAGKKREAPKEPPKKEIDVFAHLRVKDEDKPRSGLLMKMLDEVDIKYKGKVRQC